MKIARVESIRVTEHPNLIWIRLTTEEGLTGLGETFFGAAAVEAWLHETAAPKLLGADPLSIDRIAADLTGYVGNTGTGAEVRGASAVDIALWDLFGKALNQPVWQLLGGRRRDRIRTYNTCAGTHYVRNTKQQTSANWGLDRGPSDGFDDLNAFLHRADELAVELLESGITGMKIWPFDLFAERSNGLYISGPDLRHALAPFEKIRRAVGDRMDIMVEFHSLWQLPPAIRIAEALAPFDTFWHEDPIRMDSLASLKRYAERSRAPVCASERLATRWAFRDLLDTHAVGIVMLDLSWCGGLSEARRIAIMAETFQLPVAPHDCTGPVVLTASTHLCLHAPNALIQESVRAFYHTWYRDLVTALPPIENGFITTPEGPGLGLELVPDLAERFTAIVRVSELS